MTEPTSDLWTRPLDRIRGHKSARKQLAERIEQAIRSGELSPGDALPSESKIAASLGISLTIAHLAVDDVYRYGLVVKRAGALTRVAEPPKVRDISQSRYAEVLAQLDAGEEPTTVFLREQGITEDDYRLDVDYFRDKAEVLDAHYLDVEVGDEVQRRHHVKVVRGVPIQIQRSTVPWDIAKGTDLADPEAQPVPGGTIAELYRAGHRVTHISERVWGRMPTDDERERLQLVAEGPVWDIVRVFHAGDPRRPVEASRVIRDMATCALVFETDVSP